MQKTREGDNINNLLYLQEKYMIQEYQRTTKPWQPTNLYKNVKDEIKITPIHQPTRKQRRTQTEESVKEYNKERNMRKKSVRSEEMNGIAKRCKTILLKHS